MSYSEIFTNFDAKFYRPLLHSVFKLNFDFFGMKPFPISLFKIILHALSAFMVFLFCRNSKILSEYAELAGILFLLHFAHVEAVVWYSASDVMASLFILLALLLHQKGKLLFAGLSFALALLGKESGAIFIGIAAVFDIYDKKHTKPRKMALSYLPYIVIFIAYMALRFRGITTSANESYSLAFGLNIIKNYAYMLSAMVLPFNFFDIQQALQQQGIGKFIIQFPWIIVSMMAVFALYVIIYINKRCSRKFFIAMFVSFLPFGLLGGSGERFLYLPSIFFILILIIAIEGKKYLKIIIPVALILFTLNSQLKWAQSGQYVEHIAEMVRDMEEAGADTVYILEPIDNIDGAYAFRNGIDKLGPLLTDNRIKTIAIEESNNLSEDAHIIDYNPFD